MKKRFRYRNRRLGRPINKANDELKYWRLLWRKARCLAINLPDKKWCDYWHTHFDWKSRGKRSRFEHRKHIRPLMFAFARVKSELANQLTPYQVFVCIYPLDPGSDAIYVHTPNPQTEFPRTFEECEFTDACPSLLMGLVDFERCKVGVSKHQGETCYTIIPR